MTQIKEVIEILGEWFLPTDHNNKVYGTLKHDPLRGTYLDLYGNIESNNPDPRFVDQEIIIGISNQGEYITLNKCLITMSGGTLIQGEENGKPLISYSIEYLLIGIHALNANDLKFSQ